MSRMRGILVGAVLLLAATNAWAQATAQINGTVADSSGAVLPGVTVVAIQTDTGFRRETVTDQEGAEEREAGTKRDATRFVTASRCSRSVTTNPYRQYFLYPNVTDQ